MSTAIRTLVSAVPAQENYTEPVMKLRMECPEGVQGTYLADTVRIPKILECGATYKVTINLYGDITAMRKISD